MKLWSLQEKPDTPRSLAAVQDAEQRVFGGPKCQIVVTFGQHRSSLKLLSFYYIITLKHCVMKGR